MRNSYQSRPIIRFDDLEYQTVSQWVQAFQSAYFEQRGTTPSKRKTWKSEYENVFKNLPQDKPLSIAILKALIVGYQPEQRQRKRACIACQKLADFAGLSVDFGPFKGDYQFMQRIDPRNIPSDDEIAQAWKNIPSPEWRWVYGAMAAFGLRPHECFLLDLDTWYSSPDDLSLQVLAGKTGDRLTFPYFPEWVETFHLKTTNPPVPTCDIQDHARLGDWARRWFHRHDLPFNLYALRHAYARRACDFGLEISIRAEMMGHSPEIHRRVYRAWINKATFERAYLSTLSKGNLTAPLPR
ncbi:site-specific integrase [Laspinema sp. D1]|uniref:Site-specific integrase n=1 Tax=Laspinema palackyanum D2a TaxID=2953684 RepID=A0ABT2MZU5_9CYAN|nr:site-specific integrase [Laspinema sp. D2a]